MKFDGKEDMQIPAHGRELDRGRIGLFKIFSLSSTVSEEPPLIELVNAKTEDTSFKVEASVRLNRPPPTVSKKQKKTLSEGFLQYELSIKPSAIWGSEHERQSADDRYQL
jgi:hypothetical protein